MARKTKGNKPNRKGRRKGEPQFIPIPHTMAQSDAWRSLSGGAVKVWIEIRSWYNGANNGQLSLSYGRAHKLLGMSRSTVKRAFDELIDKGFLIKRREGHWYGRLAAEYIVTDQSFDGVPATRDWQKWKPPEKPKKQKSVPRRHTNRSDGAAGVPRENPRCHESTRRPDLKVIDGAA